MRWRIVGASRETGESVSLDVDAADAFEAERKASALGILAATTIPLPAAELEYAAPPAATGASPSRAGAAALRWVLVVAFALGIVGVISIVLLRLPAPKPPPTAPIAGPRVMPNTILPDDLSIRTVWFRDQVHGSCSAIEIRNNRDVTITVTGVRLNDELDACQAEQRKDALIPARQSWPATVEPGQSVLAMLSNEFLARHTPPSPMVNRGPYEARLYDKPLLSVQIFTDEGTARFAMTEAPESR